MQREHGMASQFFCLAQKLYEASRERKNIMVDVPNFGCQAKVGDRKKNNTNIWSG